jgi:polyhydroxyalkanoate synthesis regulator phasin
MSNRWTDLFYSALGFVAQSRESFQQALGQLMQDSKISQEEGKKIYDDFVKSTELKREELETQLSKIVERIANNLNLATLKHIESLETKIEQLEKRIEMLENKDKPS